MPVFGKSEQILLGPGLDPAAIAQPVLPGDDLQQEIMACRNVAGNMDLPLGPFTYAISCMHCMSVSLACGGAGLGAAWGRQLAQRMLRDAGFEEIEVHSLPHDILNDYYLAQ